MHVILKSAPNEDAKTLNDDFFFVRTLMMSNKCSNFDHIERCAKQEEEEKTDHFQ